MTNADSGATATAGGASIDVWNFATEKSPTIDSLLATKHAVLTDRAARRALDKHLSALGDGSSDPRNAGIARWMLGQYHLAFDFLKQSGATGQSIEFMLAECCLRAEVQEGTSRPMRRPDLAVKRLSRLDKVQTDLRVWRLWMDALLYSEDFTALSNAVKNCPNAFKEGADILYYEGRIAESDGAREDASARYDAALQRDPTHLASLFRQAYLCDLVGDEDRALALYEAAAQHEPKDTHTLINLGILHEDNGRYDEAIACYRAILEAFPNHRRATQYLKDAEASLNMRVEDEHRGGTERQNLMFKVPVTDLELSVRARNCLQKMNIQTIGDLVGRTDGELLAYRNLGDTTLQEIKSVLAAKGLRLGMIVSSTPLPPLEIPQDDDFDLADLAGDFGGDALPGTGSVPIPEGISEETLNINLNEIDLSIRCRKALQTLKVVSVRDLLSHSEAELLSLKNFGLTSLTELKSKLAEFGVTIRSG